MGYKKIYLLGADQDLYLKDSYCAELSDYYQDRELLKKKNKFQMIATCNNLVSSWSTFRLMKSHNVLKEFCDKNGISVINLSSSGILDMYNNDEIDNIV